MAVKITSKHECDGTRNVNVEIYADMPNMLERSFHQKVFVRIFVNFKIFSYSQVQLPWFCKCAKEINLFHFLTIFLELCYLLTAHQQKKHK